MTITRPVGGQRPLLDDPRLPGASLVLSADALASWLSGMVGSPCTVVLRRLRHEPGSGIVVTFDLTTTRDGRRLTQPYLARASATRAGRAGRSSAAMLHGVASHQVLACDPARSVLVTGAGADAALPLLPVLFAPDGAATVLGQLLPGHRCAGTPRVRTISHDAERRWVGVLEHDDAEPLLVRAHRTLQELQRAADAYTALAGAAARMPAVVGTSTPLACTAVAFATGRPLATSSRVEDWRSAGAALAGLHDSSDLTLLGSAPNLPVDGAADTLALLLPDRAPEVRELAGILTRILERIPRDRVPLHGAFSPGRIVFDGDAAPLLVGVESAGFGPSAADVGSLVAAAMVAAETAGMAPRGRREVRAFLDGYVSVRRAPDSFAVGVHAVAQRLRTAVDPFLACAPDWRDQVGRRVDGAWTALDEVCVVGGLR